jgi:hypothetical protein
VNPFVGRREVTTSSDFLRILRLPTKTPQDQAVLAREMTEALKAPRGEMSLRGVQALALYELMSEGGLFGPMGVGTGKTLVTLLAAIVADARRPLLLLPAALLQKTIHERAELMAHWKVSTATQLFSYQMLGRESSADWLELKQPDLIIADEVHRLKNRKAAVTRRVARYMADHPDTKFVALSGTVIKNSLRDFAHILRWCLGAENAPIPQKDGELEEWADALDEKVQPLKRVRPGVLVKLAKPEDVSEDDVATSRKAFRRRLVETPGVVASLNAEQVDCSLYIEGKVYDVNRATEENFDRLRNAWETPDGWALSEAVEVWRHAKQLALGLHYAWEPRPPEEWLAKRKAWAKFVRDELSGSHTLDTEKQVRTAVERGELIDGGILQEWKEIEPTFTINPKPFWHDETALELCAAWLKREKGIVWTEHTFFAQELSRRTGAPYFGQNGRDQKGREIDKDESVTGPVIASIHSCATGKNLQYKWHKNLITSCPSGGDLLEQLLGRTHRPGQPADEVEVEILVGCIEHVAAWESALAESQMSADMMGQTFKVSFADKDFPKRDEVSVLPGARWRKVRQKKEEG